MFKCESPSVEKKSCFRQLRHPGLHQLPSNIIRKFLFGKLKLPSNTYLNQNHKKNSQIFFFPHFLKSSSTVLSFRMSQKLIIIFAVVGTFIACSSSSSEVQTNLQAEGKHYVRLSFLI
jgi:hypothetical protein